MVRDEDKMAAVMVMVPCYNESAAELRKTIDSVLANDYPDENKLLVVVADGVMTGRGEKMSCPETLGSILGFHFDIHHKGYEYESVGAKTLNEASIYSGNYKNTKHPDKTLKYIVVVKQGTKEERGTARAGNRGKRDSQLLLFGIDLFFQIVELTAKLLNRLLMRVLQPLVVSVPFFTQFIEFSGGH